VSNRMSSWRQAADSRFNEWLVCSDGKLGQRAVVVRAQVAMRKQSELIGKTKGSGHGRAGGFGENLRPNDWGLTKPKSRLHGAFAPASGTPCPIRRHHGCQDGSRPQPAKFLFARVRWANSMPFVDGTRTFRSIGSRMATEIEAPGTDGLHHTPQWSEELCHVRNTTAV
jgi:hypothetical protein